MADTVILEETTYAGFVDGQLMVSPAPFVLTEGETYRVVWDGVEHECVCSFGDGYMVADTVLDESGALLEGTFAIMYAPPEMIGEDVGAVAMMAFDLSSNTMLDAVNTSHTVAIYQVVEEDKDYLIKGSTLKGIANAIRSKSGVSGEIAVADMASKISEITGGGSDVEVVYVTFMSHDGATELHKRAVVPGNSCMCPVTGVIQELDTPTRESTAQYDYTFAGWSTEVNGGLNADALKNVTEDRTVYANYIATVRYYTISYYDGDTLLKTESLAYGVTPSYTPTKDGHTFTGWSPSLAEVTTDASYYSQWIAKVDFNALTWAEIANYAEQGIAAEVFDLGATKTFTTDWGTHTARIIAFNHDDLADGTGKAGITLRLEGFTPGADAWHATGTAERLATMWDGCGARKYLRGYVDGSMTSYKFDADLYAVMKTVSKKYYDYNTSELVSCEDFIFLPSLYEVTGGGKAEGEQYEYYKTVENRIITVDGTAKQYWTRTKQSATTAYVYAITTSGSNTSVSQDFISTTYRYGCVCI